MGEPSASGNSVNLTDFAGKRRFATKKSPKKKHLPGDEKCMSLNWFMKLMRESKKRPTKKRQKAEGKIIDFYRDTIMVVYFTQTMINCRVSSMRERTRRRWRIILIGV